MRVVAQWYGGMAAHFCVLGRLTSWSWLRNRGHIRVLLRSDGKGDLYRRMLVRESDATHEGLEAERRWIGVRGVLLETHTYMMRGRGWRLTSSFGGSGALDLQHLCKIWPPKAVKTSAMPTASIMLTGWAKKMIESTIESNCVRVRLGCSWQLAPSLPSSLVGGGTAAARGGTEVRREGRFPGGQSE